MGRLADPSVIDRLHAAVRAVRDLVNVKRRHRALMKDKAAYNTICAAMDTIGDTAQALGTYDEFEKTTDKGQAYLLAYGTLQTLYLQQDAVFWLG